MRETKEADLKGELFDWDETVTELAIEISQETQEIPEDYEKMIPKRYRSAS